MFWAHQGGLPDQGERGSHIPTLHTEQRSEGRLGTGWAMLENSWSFRTPGLRLRCPRSEQRLPLPSESPPGLQRSLSTRALTHSSKASFP